MDRAALEAERADLERKKARRQQSGQPHTSAIAMIDERLAEIQAALASEIILPEGE